MATLSLHVWSDAKEVALGEVLQSMTVNIGGASAQSAAVTGTARRHRRVRFFADADCYVTWGDNPTADSTGLPLGAENPEYFDIEAGQKIAVIERA